MLSHSPSGPPWAGKTTCSFAVSLNCEVGSLFSFLQSYGCPHAPPTTHTVFFVPLSPWLVDNHHMKSSNGNNIQCSHTYVKVMAPRPSFSPTCLRAVNPPVQSTRVSHLISSHHMPEEVRVLPHFLKGGGGKRVAPPHLP